MKRVNAIIGNAAFFLNVLLVFLLVMENNITQLSKWMQVAGRLHPMILHFPIALWIVALAMEWIGKQERNEEKWNDKIEFLLAFTAISAAASAVFGLLLYVSGAYENGTQLLWHKWLGTTTSLLALLLVWLRRKRGVWYRVTLLTGLVTIIIAGHLGAGITHGNDFLTAPLKSKREPIADLSKASAFSDIIQPILEEKCIGCHNPNKAKGGLQLISPEKIRKGGEEGSVLIPGSPDSSMLYQFLLLPLNDDKHMPPEGKPQPDKEEIALIHWWIRNGAPFNKTVAALQTPDSTLHVMRQKYGLSSPLDALEIPFADDQTIRTLNYTGRTVRQVSADKPYVDVFMGGKKEISSKDWEELKRISNQIVSIDCSNSMLGKDQLSHIASFPHLLKLHLENTDVQPGQVASLSDLKYLQYLNLSGTAVTEKELDALQKSKSLTNLYLYETNIPVSKIHQFAATHKGIRVGYTPDLTSDTAFAGRLSEPLVKTDSNIFTQHASVQMNFRLKGVSIYYTTNGTTPDSTARKYKSPFMIDSTCDLKVIAVKTGWKNSSIVTQTFFHAAILPIKTRLSKDPDKRYAAKKDTTLFDLQQGSTSQGDGKYLGYEGEDVEVTLDLGALKNVNSLSVGYLVNHGSFLLPPGRVEVWGGKSQGNMKKLSALSYTDTAYISGSFQRASIHRLHESAVRFLIVKIKNGGVLPKWHPSKGAKSWLFVDEIVIN
ncbi:MAG TPA: FN3 associated domain-containing protein [Flavitalea sp.]|nr:FN3 associated domain-containing protein [Flavitalea sp.]